MEKISHGVVFYPSGVGIPTKDSYDVKTVKGDPRLEALVDLIGTGEVHSSPASFELQVVETVFSIFNEYGTSPKQFFHFNLQHNPNISAVTRDFLEETLGLLDGIGQQKIKDIKDFRTISSKLMAEISAMPLMSTQHVVKHTKSNRLKRLDYPYPKGDTASLISAWASVEGGVVDMLWAASALFGQGTTSAVQ